jgi:hypothetical protein
VVAGDIGTGEFRDEMAVVGETPNVAARLQELAEPGTVLVGESTRRLVEGLFVFEELGPKIVKGIDRLITVFRVREASARSRFEATAIRGLTPWSVVTRSSTCCCPAGPTPRKAKGRWLLTGEPGIGKSRMIQALRELLRTEEVTVVRYFCSPFRAQRPAPDPDQLQRAAQLKKSDSPEVKLDKLEALLSQGTNRVAGRPPCSRRSCRSHRRERYPELDIAPSAKTLALEALLEQLAGLAARPVLVILEDAHWIDPTSAELFQLMIDRIRHMPSSC